MLITGGAGLVGGWLVRTAPDDVDVSVTVRSAPMDAALVDRLERVDRIELTDVATFGKLVAEIDPGVIIHTAYAMNQRDVLDASAAVAEVCRDTGTSLIHLSSDVVFAGEDRPYSVDDPLDPVSDYGRWKVASEAVVAEFVPEACIVRTSVVVSLDPPDGATGKLLEAVRSGQRPQLFSDEYRMPVRAVDLAGFLWDLVSLSPSGRAGVWHVPGPEVLSRLDLGRRVLTASGHDPDAVDSALAADHPDPRPRVLRMDPSRAQQLGFDPAPVP